MISAAAIIFVGNPAVADFYVLRIGNGTAFTNSGADASPVFIDHLTDAGAPAGPSIALPTTLTGSNHALTLAASSTSTGFMELSLDGQYLTLGGYDADVGTATVRQTTTGRTIGRVKLSDGSIDTTTSLADAYPGSTGNNSDIRSVISTNGTDFWMSGTTFPTTGGQGGVRYTTLGSTTSFRVAGSPTNTRVVNIFNDQLYMASASGAFQGISTVGSGLPKPDTNDLSATIILPGFPTTSSTSTSNYDFWFKDANTIYVANDPTIANGGGIQKWTFDGSAWSLAYTLNSGLSAGVRGLDGAIVEGNAVLYAVTGTTSGIASDSIVTVTDTGAASAFSTIVTSETAKVFRGIVHVASAAVPGDYSGDGKVDAADYVLWRDNPANFGGDPAGYNTWRANFGTGGGAGSGLGSSAAVPEPASLVLLMLGMGIVGVRRR